MARALRLLALSGLLAGLALPAAAQFASLGASRTGPPLSRTEPVTFTADSVQNDRDAGIVTASGHVEAWQNDHVLRADKVTFDRNTNVAAASGHVVMVEPDGQVVFSDYAELTQGMRDGVLRGMRAILAENGRLASNGARRTEGKINELSRAVYSTCNLCKRDPDKPPLWQLRAYKAVQDVEHKRIEYEDAVLEMYGIPVFYFPYFSHADPSAKRESGFLVPSIGNTSHLGAFASVPYFWAIDNSIDATITPTLATKTGPQVDVLYRQRFNNGAVRIDTSAGYDESTFQGHIFARGNFAYNDTWRYGFDINEATSANYLRDFHIANHGSNVLASSIYAEGFGQGAYARLSTSFYKGLDASVVDKELPFVLPRYQYSYFGTPDSLGGRLSVDTNDFNVLRRVGTNDQRAGLSVNWERPGVGAYGDVWKLTLHADGVAYNANDLNQLPNFSSVENSSTARGLPTAALELRWPLARDGVSMGSQLIEPIAQLILAPNTGSAGYRNVPNEDSLAPEFTADNLFALNRFPGIDRLEGGVRANIGVHAAWYWGDATFDGLIGQSYRLHKDDTFPSYVGLNGTVSDVVARAYLAPASWFDLTYSTRLDHKTLDVRYADALAGVGPGWLRLNGGYIFTSYDPFFLYDPLVNYQTLGYGGTTTPRNEVQIGASTHWGRWRLSGYGRRDLETSRMVAIGGEGAYEDECFIFDVKFFRRYTSINGDNGDTTVLFQITFKTVGQFGFHAM